MFAKESLLSTETHVVAGRTFQITATRDQDALLSAVQTEDDLANFPYGLMLWPSALALCEALAADFSRLRGERVLEIGAGIGLVGLVAASLGAQVVQTDYLSDALALCRRNADDNGISHIDIRHGDWRNWPDDLTNFPVVLGADVLYERSLHGTLADLLPRIVAPDGVLLLSDPMRPQSVDFMHELERGGQWTFAMETKTIAWESSPKEIALFYARRRTRRRGLELDLSVARSAGGVSPTV